MIYDEFTLPDQWAMSTLGEVVQPSVVSIDPTTVPELPYVGLEHVEAHSMRLLGAGRASDVKSTKRRFSAGDVLYGKLRPYLNKVVQVTFDGVCSTDFLVFGESEVLHREFLAHYLNQLWVAGRAHHLSTGVELPRVHWRQLSELPIAFPKNRDNQAALVSRIREAGRLRRSAAEHVGASRRSLERLRDAVVASAASGRLTADWRNSSASNGDAAALLSVHASSNADVVVNQRRLKPSRGLVLPDMSDAFPESWAYKRVRELVEQKVILDVQDGNHGDLYPRRTDFALEGGVPFVSAESVTDRVLVETSPRLKADVAQRLRIGFARAHDVILTHNATVGRVALLPAGCPDVILSTSTTYYRVDERVLRPEYLLLFMRSHFFQRQLAAVMEQTTRNQVPVTKQVELFVAVPPPAEQDLIVERASGALAHANRAIDEVTRADRRIEHTAQAVLAKAFRGDVVIAG